MTATKHNDELKKEMARYERYMKEISIELEIEKNKERQAQLDYWNDLSILRREYNTR